MSSHDVSGSKSLSEILDKGGIGFTAGKEPIFLGGARLPVEGFSAVVRGDTGDVLSVMGDRYSPINNIDGFDIVNQFLREGAFPERAGSFGLGAQSFVQLTLPETIEIPGLDGDTLRQNFTLYNSFDGSPPHSISMTPIRIICYNSFLASLGAKTNIVSIRHSGDTDRKLEEVGRILGLVRKYYDDLLPMAGRLVETRLDSAKVGTYLDSVFGVADSTRAKSNRAEILTLVDSGKGSEIPGVKGTLWGAFNAVTEYVDHFRASRGAGEDSVRQAESRLKSSMLGSGALLKAKAWSRALEVANV